MFPSGVPVSACSRSRGWRGFPCSVSGRAWLFFLTLGRYAMGDKGDGGIGYCPGFGSPVISCCGEDCAGEGSLYPRM